MRLTILRWLVWLIHRLHPNPIELFVGGQPLSYHDHQAALRAKALMKRVDADYPAESTFTKDRMIVRQLLRDYPNEPAFMLLKVVEQVRRG